MGKRYAVFYLLGCVASAFAGILAYGLMQMNGLADLTGCEYHTCSATVARPLCLQHALEYVPLGPVSGH